MISRIHKSEDDSYEETIPDSVRHTLVELPV